MHILCMYLQLCKKCAEFLFISLCLDTLAIHQDFCVWKLKVYTAVLLIYSGNLDNF